MTPQWIVKGVQVLDDYKLLITFQYDEKKNIWYETIIGL